MLPNITVVEVLVILLNLPLLKKKGYALYLYFSKDFSKHSFATILTGGKKELTTGSNYSEKQSLGMF